MSIEREYGAVDFSQFSKVKESLRAKLHTARQQAPVARGKVKLSMDELDCVAAAGTGAPPMPPKPQSPPWLM